MNGQDYKNAFGRAPDSFKSCVAFTLSRVEEEKKVKKFGKRLILLAGIILILMAGVVYAASMEWKILDFVKAWYSKAPTANLEKAMKENGVSQTIEAGEFTVKVEEAVADGKYMYISANVSMKNGENAFLLPMNISSTKRICDVVGPRQYILRLSRSYPLDSQNELISDKLIDTPSVSSDDRTFRTAAMQDGKRLIGTSMWVKYGNEYNEMTSFAVLPDGSVSFVFGSTVAAEDKTLDVELNLSAGEVDWAGTYIKERVRKIIPLTLPVLPETKRMTVDAEDVSIDGSDVKVERIELTLTPITLYYELYFSAPSDLLKGDSSDFYLEFLNDKGKRILSGLSILTRQENLEGCKYVQTGSLLLDNIPQTITLRGYSFLKQKKYGEITLNIKKKP